jgi:hypothetical protein
MGTPVNKPIHAIHAAHEITHVLFPFLNPMNQIKMLEQTVIELCKTQVLYMEELNRYYQQRLKNKKQQQKKLISNMMSSDHQNPAPFLGGELMSLNKEVEDLTCFVVECECVATHLNSIIEQAERILNMKE